jgi:hypothetical protein
MIWASVRLVRSTNGFHSRLSALDGSSRIVFILANNQNKGKLMKSLASNYNKYKIQVLKPNKITEIMSETNLLLKDDARKAREWRGIHIVAHSHSQWPLCGEPSSLPPRCWSLDYLNKQVVSGIYSIHPKQDIKKDWGTIYQHAI